MSSHDLIFTARKRSLEQGNIFTPVCHSVHRGGRVWLLPGGVRGCSRGGACMVAPGGPAWLLPGGGACMGYDEIRRYGQ